MFDTTRKSIPGALLLAIVAAMCGCQIDEPAQPPVAPKTLLQMPPAPSSFIGTLPAPRADEKVITPAETVGAAAY